MYSKYFHLAVLTKKQMYFVHQNSGTHNPSYIYRLLAEYYDSEDYILDSNGSQPVVAEEQQQKS